MIILNFSHPLTPTQLRQIEGLTGQLIERVVEVSTQFDHGRLFPGQTADRRYPLWLGPKPGDL